MIVLCLLRSGLTVDRRMVSPRPAGVLDGGDGEERERGSLGNVAVVAY